jgi:CheY-like chemotaxis protein
MRTLTAEDRTRATPVLMLSNSSRQQDGQKVVQLGAVGCLAESNLSLQELGNRVAQLWGA